MGIERLYVKGRKEITLTTGLGMFDSGVGGLSVLRELRAVLPDEQIVYVADSANVPYGTKSPELIRDRSMRIARFLVEERHARAVVVACNTATTHAVDLLRQTFPSVPFVGMEPAIKPAAAATRRGVIGYWPRTRLWTAIASRA